LVGIKKFRAGAFRICQGIYWEKHNLSVLQSWTRAGALGGYVGYEEGGARGSQHACGAGGPQYSGYFLLDEHRNKGLHSQGTVFKSYTEFQGNLEDGKVLFGIGLGKHGGSGKNTLISIDGY